ncbi:MAG: J domain-containing protein [Actinomycetota bacterium]
MIRGTPEDLAARDLYAILGVSASATQDEIIRAYRRLARSTHPDVNTADPGAEAEFEELAAARDVLTDPDSRAAYDEARRNRRQRERRRVAASASTDGAAVGTTGRRRTARPSGTTIRPGPVIWTPDGGRWRSPPADGRLWGVEPW